MYIAIVDDQLPEIKRIELLLKKEFESQQIMIEIDYFTSGKDFAGEWNPGKYDMVILDIYMEEMTGIEVGQFIRQRDDNAKIVFYTSSNEFASESYNLNASYYLLKPATPVQLHNMFLRCFPELGEQKRIMILPDGQKIIRHSILFAEYDEHILTIHYLDEESVSTRMRLYDFEEFIKSETYLFSCTRGVIINMEKILEFDAESITMENGSVFPVSRRRKKDFETSYAEFRLKKIQDKNFNS